MKELSIIIVSFNSLAQTTRPCLESIFKNTTGIDFEVIVVDNDSKDGTQEFLAKAALTEPRLRVLVNSANLGYAAANNQGIEVAVGNCLVLLNSDTEVTPQSMATLARYLRVHPEVGLVGPVTNSAGNEQRIYVTAKDIPGIIEEGRLWAETSTGDTFETHRLGFFCVAMRKDHVERVGLLDVAFGLGFFEDDDYCIRSLKAGFRLVCLEDVFVYHRGSESFKQQPSDAVKQLMKQNKRLLESKHGRRYRPAASRTRQLELAWGYLNSGTPKSVGHLLYKMENRGLMARASQPRSRLKRWFFSFRCRRLSGAIQRTREKLNQNPEPGQHGKSSNFT